MPVALAWTTGGLAAIAAWFAVLGLVAWRSRAGLVSAGPATQDLGEEPPALAHLLTNRWKVEPEAAEATLVDLAARGYITIERVGNEPHEAVCRVVKDWDDELTGYENHVLSRVNSKLVGDVVPLTALTGGDEQVAGWWIDVFGKKVIADARERGLSRPRLSTSARVGLVALTVVPALMFGIALYRVFPGQPATLLGGLPLMIFLGYATFWIKGERDTPRGREAAARWMGVRQYLAAHPSLAATPPAGVVMWGRHLAFAAATGVAKETLRILELGSGDKNTAWSAHGGVWRKVRVRYPRRPAWGRPPLKTLGIGLGWIAWGVLVLWQLGAVLREFNSAVAGVAVAVSTLGLAWGLFTAGRAFVDLVAPKTAEGLVLRVRRQRRLNLTGPRYVKKHRMYIAIDQGEGDTIAALVMPDAMQYTVQESDVVRLSYGRCYGFVRRLEVVRRNWEWREAPTAGSYDPATDATPTRPLDPARLLTADDIAAATGSPAQPAFAGTPFGPDVPGQRFQLTGATPATVTVYSAVGETGANLMRTVQRRARLEGGIGDEAYVSDDAIIVRRGGVFAYIQVAAPQPSGWMLAPLAKAVVPRLAAPGTPAFPLSTPR